MSRTARPLFVATILTGSFLLFLVQPMVARMALPRLGGAPNVWNSAMLVYQALLLGGYAYAHWLGRHPVARQAVWHGRLLLVAGAFTLPITLVDLPPAAPGWEPVWVPALLALSVGPVFLLVSAQAPLMQRWYAADPSAQAPWALYAASNIGSFAGLLAYPVVAEPLLGIREQSWAWAIGYGVLVAMVIFAARARRHVPQVGAAPADATAADHGQPISRSRIALWLALSAVPSGLMLSTTTHLTTDIFAMPLLWVIPLGLYLLSFVVAFSDRQDLAWAIRLVAPLTVLGAGGLAMVSRGSSSMVLVLASVILLFVVAVALHARMYELRPHASRLTLFYLVMSIGGALGGVFTALIAPALFDWVWEHPLLVLLAAAIMPLPCAYDWRRMPGLEPGMARAGATVLALVAAFLCWQLIDIAALEKPGAPRVWLTLGVALCGLALAPWRWLFVAVLLLLMLAQGGLETIDKTVEHARIRSYFGIYTVRDHPGPRLRTLAHGTTLHGQQSTDPAMAREPMTYYGRTSGVGIALAGAPALFGPQARIGVVGLGTGTLACYVQPGETLTYFEIDPAVLRLSQVGTFTFLRICAPRARIALGDARIELAKVSPGAFDVLVIDAFSSDAIPLHLLTDEAFGVYLRALAPGGVLVVHISNRYIELEPVLAAAAKQRGLAASLRDDNPYDHVRLAPSSWVAMSRDPARLGALAAIRADAPWRGLQPAAPRAWTDDHASILPYIRWHKLLGTP